MCPGLTSDGTDLVVDVTGTDSSVVSVPGSNGGLNPWVEVGRRLTRVVRYARRNHPPSAAAKSPNRFAGEAADPHAVPGFVPVPLVSVHTSSAGPIERRVRFTPRLPAPTVLPRWRCSSHHCCSLARS